MVLQLTLSGSSVDSKLKHVRILQASDIMVVVICCPWCQHATICCAATLHSFNKPTTELGQLHAHSAYKDICYDA